MGIAERLSEADWRQILNHDVEFASERLAMVGQVDTMFVLYTRQDGMILFPAEWDDTEDKRRIARTLFIVGVAYDVVAASFMSEAWGRDVEYRIGETHQQRQERAEAVLPADAEDRFEAVVNVLIYRDSADALHTLAAMGEIVRDAEGRPTGTRRMPDPGPASEMTGPMMGILPISTPTQEQRESARNLLSVMNIKVEPKQRPQ